MASVDRRRFVGLAAAAGASTAWSSAQAAPSKLKSAERQDCHQFPAITARNLTAYREPDQRHDYRSANHPAKQTMQIFPEKDRLEPVEGQTLV